MAIGVSKILLVVTAATVKHSKQEPELARGQEMNVNVQRLPMWLTQNCSKLSWLIPETYSLMAKSPGETSLVVEQENGNRLLYDLTIRPRAAKLEAVRLPISRESPYGNIGVTP